MKEKILFFLFIMTVLLIGSTVIKAKAEETVVDGSEVVTDDEFVFDADSGSDVGSDSDSSASQIVQNIYQCGCDSTAILADVSNLQGDFDSMETTVSGLQAELVSVNSKLEEIKTLQGSVILELSETVEQLEYIVCFCLMLVFFELMRLVRGWTKGVGLK